jgi:FMN phosphatase YigB (HAD superfamily)
MAIHAIFFDLGDTLVKASPKSWLPAAKSLLASLKQKGFRLGIISNTGNLANRQAILNLLPTDFQINDFEPGLVLFSSEVGIEKPKKAIFEKAVGQAGIPANQCLYCSENIVETLVAQHVGMTALRVQPPPGTDLGVVEHRIAEFHNEI